MWRACIAEPARLCSCAQGNVVTMFNARKKIAKPAGAEPTEFETSVAQALFDLEATNTELKTELRDLYVCGAREIDVSPTRKAVLIQVRERARDAWKRHAGDGVTRRPQPPPAGLPRPTTARRRCPTAC